MVHKVALDFDHRPSYDNHNGCNVLKMPTPYRAETIREHVGCVHQNVLRGAVSNLNPSEMSSMGIWIKYLCATPFECIKTRP